MGESAVSFVCQSDTLVGIVHRPHGAYRPVGILVVVGGPQYRVGSHRQFVLMARRFAAAGYPVLRFDYRGMGDSEGEPRGFQRVDDDIRAAIDALMQEVSGLRGVVLFGLCDGASAAMIHGPRDPRVVGWILANVWVRTAAGGAKALVKHYYARRLLQKTFWTKLLSGGVHPLRATRSLVAVLGRTFGAPAARSSVEQEPFLELMAQGAAGFGKPILVLSSQRDLTAREFDDLCRQSRRWGELMARSSVEWAIIRDADHTFSTITALQEAADRSLHWLENRCDR